MTTLPHIMWAEYENGTVRYYADIPNQRPTYRRWVWQAKRDAKRHQRSLSDVVVARIGVYTPARDYL